MFPAQASRLGQMMDLAGGVTAEKALSQAEANLQPLRTAAMNHIAGHVAELAKLDGCDADLDRVYFLGSAIIDCASLFDQGEICAVAAGLCDLVQDASTDRPFDWRMPALHARTLKLLLSLPRHALEQRLKLRDQIAAVVAHKRASRPAASGCVPGASTGGGG